jgi:hypothetical protein
MTGHDEKFDPVAFIADDERSFAIVVELFWRALHVKYIYVDDKYLGKELAPSLWNPL